jgi:UDP-2,4-diacetamido-2,4,6-trideoxy-beta-L-altropyranose hydrolase
VNPGLLLLRADASEQMGTGHLMRCLGLTEFWRERGGQVLLATHSNLEPLLERFRAEGAEIIRPKSSPASIQEARELAAAAKNRSAKWIALDGYHFPAEYHERLGQGARVLLIDDNGHAGRYTADVVLDQNLTATENNYRQRGKNTHLLLGTKYALLRREFRIAKQECSKQAGEKTRVLVSTGGSDPENVMAKVLRAVGGKEHVEVRAVIGAGNKFFTTLREITRQSPTPIRLETNAKMPELMAWADIAISAAGATLWELAFMGVPTLTVELMDHQRPIAHAFANWGAGINLGWHGDLQDAKIVGAMQSLLADKARCSAMSAKGRALVDGRGSGRVFAALMDFA